MTVKELRERLAYCSDELQIVYYDEEWCIYRLIEDSEEKTIDAEDYDGEDPYKRKKITVLELKDY